MYVCVYNVRNVLYTEESNLDKKYCFFVHFLLLTLVLLIY